MSRNRPKCSDIPDVEILRACEAFHNHSASTPDEALSDRWPAKVIMAKMEKLSKRGLIECGASLRTSWLTYEGRKVLEGSSQP